MAIAGASPRAGRKNADGQDVVVALSAKGAARLTLTYQRQKASGTYEDAYNIVCTSDGVRWREPVCVTVKSG
jgi:hypothetical protein